MPGNSPELPSDISPSDATDAVSGIGESYSSRLAEHGYTDVQDLQDATVAELSEHIPADVAQDAKETVGDGQTVVTTAAEARDAAQQIPGAIAKVVKQNGRQVPKVLEKVSEQHLAGSTVEIHKG